MKQIIIFLLFSSLFLSACSGNKAVSSAFQKYGYEDGVVKLSVPGWVIDLGVHLADLDAEERALIGQIDKVKILTIEDPALNSMTNFYDEYYHQIKAQKGYEDLVMVREDKENVGILGKFDGDNVKELIILVGGEENTIVYLKGEFGEELIKAISKNNKKDILEKI